MERIKLLTKEQAPEKAKDSLEAINQQFGKIPNIFKMMANSSAVIKTYLAMNDALSEKMLDDKIAERIAVQIAAQNGCEYCSAAHSFIASKIISEEEIKKSREAKSEDSKVQAALEFAGSVMKNAGKVSDEELEKVKNAGYSEGEILEIIAVVALNFFTNALNNVAQTPVDFPKPKE